MSTPPDDTSREFAIDCRALLAQVGLQAAEKMTIEKKIMIHRAIASLFPKTSEEHQRASDVADSLTAAEKSQLQLARLFNSIRPEAQ